MVQDGKMKQYIEANQLMHTQYKNLQVPTKALSLNKNIFSDLNVNFYCC